MTVDSTDKLSAEFDRLFTEVLVSEGFASLQFRIQSSRKRIGLRFRELLDREGWVA